MRARDEHIGGKGCWRIRLQNRELVVTPVGVLRRRIVKQLPWYMI
jgi:hypothetical protein